MLDLELKDQSIAKVGSETRVRRRRRADSSASIALFNGTFPIDPFSLVLDRKEYKNGFSLSQFPSGYSLDPDFACVFELTR